MEKFCLDTDDQRLVSTTIAAFQRLLLRFDPDSSEAVGLRRVIEALERLPDPTDGLDVCVILGLSQPDSYTAWTVEFDAGMLSLGVGGHVSAATGSDTYSSYQYTLYSGQPGEGVEHPDEHDYWLAGLPAWVNEANSVEVEDRSRVG